MDSERVSDDFDAVIVGGGPVGYAAGLALASTGARLALITGQKPGASMPDLGRTAALMRGSLDFLKTLGVGDAIDAVSWPLAAIRMIDAKGGLIRAPTTTFRAVELGETEFGRNIRNADLVDILRAKTETTSIAVIDDMFETATRIGDSVVLRCKSGRSLRAKLAIAADGRRSMLREAAAIKATTRDCRQTALTFHVSHLRDHEDVSTEYHAAEGPFTIVPLAASLSSVVWVVEPMRAKRLLTLDDEAFALAAERECQSLLGRFTLKGKRGSYPLVASMADRFALPGFVLAGEAAHAFPPIGAQGLNLGFRDAREIGRLDLDGADLPAQLGRYDRSRRLDASSRALAVDMLNRSLLSTFLPVDLVRAAGLAALGSLSPLRKAAMWVGMGQDVSTLRLFSRR